MFYEVFSLKTNYGVKSSFSLSKIHLEADVWSGDFYFQDQVGCHWSSQFFFLWFGPQVDVLQRKNKSLCLMCQTLLFFMLGQCFALSG